MVKSILCSLANSKSFFGSKSKINVLSIVPFSLFTFFVPDTNSISFVGSFSFEKFLKNYVPNFTFPETKKHNPILDTIDVELSIADFHLAKKTLEGESILDKQIQFIDVVADLLNKVTNNYNINTIVFPIGNDYFHTDNYQNNTTNGTPQDVLSGYDNEYEKGFDLTIE